MTNMSRISVRTISLVAMALPAFAPLSAQSMADAEAAYARAAKSWSTTRTLQANFDQRITNPILGRTVASRGVFVQERPNRVSITFTEPAGDRIVGDAITGGESMPIAGRSTRRVQLVPKSPNAVPFSKAVLWLDDKDARPVRVQVLDSQGVDRTITLTSWAPDAVLPRDAFTFVTPKGVKVSTKIPGSR